MINVTKGWDLSPQLPILQGTLTLHIYLRSFTCHTLCFVCTSINWNIPERYLTNFQKILLNDRVLHNWEDIQTSFSDISAPSCGRMVLPDKKHSDGRKMQYTLCKLISLLLDVTQENPRYFTKEMTEWKQSAESLYRVRDKLVAFTSLFLDLCLLPSM